MSDVIDQGNDTAELFLRAALANRDRTELKPCGHCHYCSDSVPEGHLFCPESECPDDWHEEERRKRIAGR